MSPDKAKDYSGLAGLIDRVRGSQPEKERPPESDASAAPVSQTFLIVGLGNPGKEYAGNRHNIGFMFIDRLASRLDVSFSRMQARALTADARYEEHRLILVKPQTYMNESGQSVASLQKFYKVPFSCLIVAFDDMDLPLGRLRIRPKGGSSGQKGMQSIIQRLGNNQGFPRIRLGVGRPDGRMPPEAFLLQNFSKGERIMADGLVEEAVEAVLVFVKEGLDAAMNRFNISAAEND